MGKGKVGVVSSANIVTSNLIKEMTHAATNPNFPFWTISMEQRWFSISCLMFQPSSFDVIKSSAGRIEVKDDVYLTSSQELPAYVISQQLLQRFAQGDKGMRANLGKEVEILTNLEFLVVLDSHNLYKP